SISASTRATRSVRRSPCCSPPSVSRSASIGHPTSRTAWFGSAHLPCASRWFKRSAPKSSATAAGDRAPIGYGHGCMSDPGEVFAYWPDRDRTLDWSRCFLCGVHLTKENRTDEHVFPQWMLRDFKLYDSEIELLNGTFIRYRALKIPCCSECNNYWLSQIES